MEDKMETGLMQLFTVPGNYIPLLGSQQGPIVVDRVTYWGFYFLDPPVSLRGPT